MERVRVAIHPQKTEGIINPNVFSHNLEHTRSCIYQGLSAQILRNRKFAGKPAAHSGQAAEWYRIGGREVYLTLDRFDAYVKHSEEWFTGILRRRNELNSQVVQNPYAGLEAGIGQDGVVLEKNREYQVRSVIKTNSDEVFSYTIRIVNARTRRVYAEHVETPAQHEWKKATFVFTAPESTDNACFEVITRNRGEMKIGVVSLIPTDHVLGLRPDVIDKLREIGPAVLRWPGGNFAGEYHWKDGLMDVDMRGAQKSVREMETHPYTQGFDFHEMAIDDFIQLCHMVGAEPYLTINFGRDSAEACAQFVEYCNGTADTEWGRVRADRGFEQPYAVKYWSWATSRAWDIWMDPIRLRHTQPRPRNTPGKCVKLILRLFCLLPVLTTPSTTTANGWRNCQNLRLKAYAISPITIMHREFLKVARISSQTAA